MYDQQKPHEQLRQAPRTPIQQSRICLEIDEILFEMDREQRLRREHERRTQHDLLTTTTTADKETNNDETLNKRTKNVTKILDEDKLEHSNGNDTNTKRQCLEWNEDYCRPKFVVISECKSYQDNHQYPNLVLDDDDDCSCGSSTCVTPVLQPRYDELEFHQGEQQQQPLSFSLSTDSVDMDDTFSDCSVVTTTTPSSSFSTLPPRPLPFMPL